MPSKFGGIPVESEEQSAQPPRSRFGGIPVDQAPPPAASASQQTESEQTDQRGGIADTALEFMAAVNRGTVSLADMPANIFNYLSEKAGSDVRAARFGDAEVVQQGTRGEFMEPGLARDVVRGAGEVVPAAVGSAAAAGRAAQQLPRFTAASEGVAPGVLRQAGQETVPAAAATGAAAGAGAEAGGAAGEAVGGEEGRLAGEFVGGVLSPVGAAGAMQTGRALATRPRDIDVPEGEATSFAREQGLPLATSDIRPPRTFAGRSGAAAAEKIPVAGTGGMREAQQEARMKTVRDYVETFGEYRPEDVVSSLQSSKSRIKRAAGKARQQYADQVADQPAVNRAIQSIDDEIHRLSFSPSGNRLKTADETTIAKLQDYRDDLLEDPTFGNLDRLRTTFREGVKGERMTVPNRSKAAMEKIYSAMTEDMDSVVRSELGEDSAKKWKRANLTYANEAQELKNTRLKSVLDRGDLTPETVNNLLYSNKPSEVKRLYNSLAPKGKKAARAGLITKAVEKATRDDEISPDRFLNELNKLSKQTDISFQGEDRKFLNGLKAYLGATRQAAKAGVLTSTGEQLFQIGAPTAVTSDIMTTGGVGTGAVGMYGLMARAYESAPVRKSFQRLAASKPRSDAYYKAISDSSALLSSLAGTEPLPEERQSSK